MALFHKIALAAALVALPQVARGQEAPQEASLTEQIAADVARERSACATAYNNDQRSPTYKLPQAEKCAVEVAGADMLLNHYASSLNALEISIRTAVFFLKKKGDKAIEEYLTGRPLPMPPLPGESDWDAVDRKADYQQQSANADIAKMTAERQCVADKARMTDMNMTLRGHYETEFKRGDNDFLLRFSSYGAVKKAMFAMLDKYQKEVNAISCAVVR